MVKVSGNERRAVETRGNAPYVWWKCGQTAIIMFTTYIDRFWEGLVFVVLAFVLLWTSWELLGLGSWFVSLFVHSSEPGRMTLQLLKKGHHLGGQIINVDS